MTEDRHLRDDVRYGFPADCDVTVVHDARAAWIAMASTTPDVVIVDIHTGSAGGYALRRDMLANQRLARVPMLMLLDRPQDAWLARQAGANLHLVKPVDVSELIHQALALVPSGIAS